jgi:hypothetical protein
MTLTIKIFRLFVVIPCLALAENKTDISLFFKEDPDRQVAECFSESGDLYMTLGHHGPAIENEYVGFRMFFDQKAAIDVYSKTRPGLELEGAAWYPTNEQQAEGWGGDHYHVGATVGLGGIRLWDGEKVIPLDPVSGRYGRVVKEGSVSFLEIRSKGIPYRGREVDILVRVTVFSGSRNAKVEVFALSDEQVQFVTGLNHREGEMFISEEDYYLSWASSSGGVATGDVEVGAAILFNPDHIDRQLNDEAQRLVVSTPRKHFEYWISSANSKETELNTLKKFKSFVSASRK